MGAPDRAPAAVLGRFANGKVSNWGTIWCSHHGLDTCESFV